MGKLYDEELLSEVLSDIGKINNNIDGCMQQLQAIVNSDGYYAKGTSGITGVSKLLNINGEFSSYLTSAKSLYDKVYNDIKSGVDDIETANTDIVFDALISDMSLVTQTDAFWCDVEYKSSGTGERGSIGGNGCGPCSVVNGLITTFGLSGKDNIRDLILECISFKDPVREVTSYLTDPTKRDDKCPILNSIKDNNNIVAIGTDGKTILANLDSISGDCDYLGNMQFDDDKTYSTLLSMVDKLYETYPDATITFYGMTGGKGNTFGSGISASGHYVSLMVNVREFKEDGAVYLLDSDPRLLEGEEPTENINRYYNFAGPVNNADMRKFNELYDVSRVSENVLKVQLKNGESFNSNNLNYLGLRGGTQVAINPTPNTNTQEKDVDTTYNEVMAENMPQYKKAPLSTDAASLIFNKNREGLYSSAFTSLNNLITNAYESLKEKTSDDLDNQVIGNGDEELTTTSAEYYDCPLVKDGKMRQIYYRGKLYDVAETKVNCLEYEDWVQETKSIQIGPKYICTSHCMALAQIYVHDMMSGNKTTAETIRDGLDWSPAIRIGRKKTDPDNVDTIKKFIYDELSAGRQVVVQATQVESYTGAGKRHVVAAIGYSSDVDSWEDINPDTLLVLDCNDGRIQTLGQKKVSKMDGKNEVILVPGHERDFFNNGLYMASGASHDFLSKVVGVDEDVLANLDGEEERVF